MESVFCLAWCSPVQHTINLKSAPAPASEKSETDQLGDNDLRHSPDVIVSQPSTSIEPIKTNQVPESEPEPEPEPVKTQNPFLNLMLTGKSNIDLSIISDEEVMSILLKNDTMANINTNGFIKFLETTIEQFQTDPDDPDDLELVKTQTMLAQELLNRSGRYADALDLCEKVYQSNEKSLGQGHEEALSIQLVKSYALLALTRHQEALENFTAIYDLTSIQQDDLEDETMLKLGVSALLGIASSLKMAGDCDKALKYLGRVYNILSCDPLGSLGQMEVGANNVEIIGVQFSMAKIFKKQGKLKDANILAQNSYSNLNSMANISLDDMNMIDFEHLIATLVRDSGEAGFVFELLREILNKEIHVLGINHPMSLSTLLSFGILFEKNGRQKLAGKIYQHVFERRKLVLGPDHSKTVKAGIKLNNLTYK